MKKRELAQKLIATELTIGQTKEQIIAFTQEAVKRGLLGVCVYQNMVLTAIEAAGASGLKVFTVSGFPSGIDVPVTKVADVELSAKNGAAGVDMGVNLSAWKSDDQETLVEELKKGSSVAHSLGSTFTAVLNTYQLEDEDVEKLTALCVECGVDAVKTTSGDSVIPRATTPHDVELIKKVVCKCGTVKAEGQIDTLKAMEEMLNAGADVVYSNHAFDIYDSAED